MFWIKFIDSDFDREIEDFLFRIRNEDDEGHRQKVKEFIDIKNNEITERMLANIEYDEEVDDKDDDDEEEDEEDEEDEDDDDEDDYEDEWKGIRKKLTFSDIDNADEEWKGINDIESSLLRIKLNITYWGIVYILFEDEDEDDEDDKLTNGLVNI